MISALRLYLLVAGLIALAGWLAYERHHLIQEGVKIQTVYVEKQSAKAIEKRDAAAEPIIQQEGNDLANATAKSVTDAPRVLVCNGAAALGHRVQTAAGAGPADNGATSIREADTGQPTVWDSTPTVTAGRDADVQVTELMDYISRVCQAPAK